MWQGRESVMRRYDGAHARRSRQRWLVTALSGAAALLAGAPSRAEAQVLQRFALRGEVGVGTMLSSYQRNTETQQYGGNAMGYDNLNIQATLRLGFTLIDPLVIQLSFANGFFPTSTQSGTGRLMAFEAGLRVEPRIGRVGRLFVDGNVGYALTGPLERAAINAGVGFEFTLSPAVALGPVVRFHNVLQPGTVVSPNVATYDFDATYWSAGISITLRVPPATPAAAPLPDTDCDGIIDRDDVCPAVPRGAHPDPARLGCPLEDGDHDGVFDVEDQCPAVHAGDYPDANRRGCPDDDRDHDGIPNDRDRCPILAAGPTPDAENPGCPDPHPLAVLEGDHIAINRQVHFDNRSANIVSSNPEITHANQDVLNAVVRVLQFNAPITLLEVQGHTDNTCRACPGGPRAYNLTLSQNRADAIRSYLVERGISSERLTARGYGQGTPLADNATPAGRTANRRVDFHIVNATWPAPPAPPAPVAPHPLPPPEPAAPPPAQPCHVTP
jgi:outer membrane protein OmpA-like peptidoglycan-associated protein